MSFNFYIERLVLDGLSVPYHRQPMLQKAVETELARLFTTNGLPSGLQSGCTVSDISGGEIQLTGNDENEPAYLGQQIARAVYEGVNQ